MVAAISLVRFAGLWRWGRRLLLLVQTAVLAVQPPTIRVVGALLAGEAARPPVKAQVVVVGGAVAGDVGALGTGVQLLGDGQLEGRGLGVGGGHGLR